MFDEKNPQRTPISDLGEFGLIGRLTQATKLKHAHTALGVGDDAALIDVGTHYQAVSTDLLVEGVHFDLSYMPLKHLGYKSVIVNLSDIYAMNGTPEHITVGLAVSNRFPVEALEEIYEGIHLACERYNVDLVGGDTTTSISGLTISISVLGRAPKSKVVYRSGAKEFDLLVLLASKPNTVFKREYILTNVWGTDVIVGDRTIDVHIRKIREKIGDSYIQTIKGLGYKYCPKF